MLHPPAFMLSLLPRLASAWSPALEWVAASIALYAAGAMLWWLATRRRENRWVRWLLSSLPGQLLRWLARLGWLILPGYLLLLQGKLSPRVMGLSQIDLGLSLGRGALFAAAVLAVLALVVVSQRRGRPAGSPFASTSHAVWLGTLLSMEAAALQWHWAFYRSALIGAASARGGFSAVEWGTWLAAGLVALEGALNLSLWRDLRTPGLAEPRVLRAALLLATSVLYLLSRNLWLAILLHAVAATLLEPRLAQKSSA